MAALIAVPAASAAPTPFVDIHSAGPLSDIYIGNDLGCQVRSGGFSSTEFFPNAAGPGDCGTFLFLNSDNVSGGLFGPDFANHAGGTHTTFNFRARKCRSRPPAARRLPGRAQRRARTRSRTTVTLTSADGKYPRRLQLTEVDSYVVGNDFYRTDVTVTNIGTVTPDNGGELYHAGDCHLRGSDTGFGAFEPNQVSPNTAACTPNVLGNPPSALEEFVPITAGDGWEQNDGPDDLGGPQRRKPPATPARVAVGRRRTTREAIEYPVPALTPGQSSSTFSFDTKIVDTVPTGGFSLTGTAGTPLDGTVATITDPNTSATASAYSATINWGDGTASRERSAEVTAASRSPATTPTPCRGTFPVAVTITSAAPSQGSRPSTTRRRSRQRRRPSSPERRR